MTSGGEFISIILSGAPGTVDEKTLERDRGKLIMQLQNKKAYGKCTARV